MLLHTVNNTSNGHNPMPGGDSQLVNGTSTTLLPNEVYTDMSIHLGPRLIMSTSDKLPPHISRIRLDAEVRF